MWRTHSPCGPSSQLPRMMLSMSAAAFALLPVYFDGAGGGRICVWCPYTEKKGQAFKLQVQQNEHSLFRTIFRFSYLLVNKYLYLGVSPPNSLAFILLILLIYSSYCLEEEGSENAFGKLFLQKNWIFEGVGHQVNGRSYTSSPSEHVLTKSSKVLLDIKISFLELSGNIYFIRKILIENISLFRRLVLPDDSYLSHFSFITT